MSIQSQVELRGYIRMSSVTKRLDQIAIVICNPTRHVMHYTLEEIKGVIINFSSEDLYVGSKSWGSLLGRVQAHVHPDFPNVLPAHSSTGEIVLLNLEINRNDVDPYDNMILGRFGFQYSDASGKSYAPESALFQLILR